MDLILLVIPLHFHLDTRGIDRLVLPIRLAVDVQQTYLWRRHERSCENRRQPPRSTPTRGVAASGSGMAEPTASPSPEAAQWRPSSAGELAAVRHKNRNCRGSATVEGEGSESARSCTRSCRKRHHLTYNSKSRSLHSKLSSELEEMRRKVSKASLYCETRRVTKR